MLNMTGVDVTIALALAAITLTFVYILWSYAKGLGDSPRELWLVTGSRMLEGAAYFATVFAMALWLSTDCGLSDIQAGWFISFWYVLKACFGVVSGPFIDAFGIRRSLIFSFVLILLSRVFIVVVTDPVLVMLLVFLPVAIGVALLEPVGLIAMKRYTTAKSANLAFGMIYVVMNVAMSAGLIAFDNVRAVFGESSGTSMPLIGHLSSYQVLFLLGLISTGLGFLLVLFTRDGIHIEQDGVASTRPERPSTAVLNVVAQVVKKAFRDIAASLADVVRQPIFWKFVFIISLTLFVRSTFFHLFNLFPKYGVRVLGEGAQVGTIFGILNPFLIIFLVPLAATLTRNVSSYTCLIVGTAISSLAVFVATIPGSVFSSLTDTALGEIVFVRWLGIAADAQALAISPPSDFYWPLCFFIIIWSLGESIWYPRLIQFMTEIAPKGSEGTYLGLVGLTSYIPSLFTGPMSGLLLEVYTPMVDVVDSAGRTTQVVGDLSHHYMVWVWIGAVAVLTPIGLIAFRKIYHSMRAEMQDDKRVVASTTSP